MNRGLFLRLAAVAFASPLVLTFGQRPAAPLLAAAEPAVELPPLIVEEPADAPPWLYVEVNGMEYLSRCSESTTREYVQNWQRAMQRVGTMVPERLLPRDLPGITIMDSQRFAASTGRELLAAVRQSAPAGSRGPGFLGDPVLRFAPNMRLSDSEGYATFTYINERFFRPEDMHVAPAYLRFLLERRVPVLPDWFIEGMGEVYESAKCVPDSDTLAPIFWVSLWQTKGLSQDPDYPRLLLPAAEFFAPDVLRGPRNHNPIRADIVAAQRVLFIRWALETGPATREALWQFAARSAEEPPTEALFAACFGFGYSDLRDRLSDYLPRAIGTACQLAHGKLPAVPRPAIRRATPAEIARLRGQWERLGASFVAQQWPQLQARYLDQARHTLERSFNEGNRDPRLLAELGLCAVEAADRANLLFYLQPASAAKGARPRAGYELARFRFQEVVGTESDHKYPASDLAPILAPLRLALTARPALPEAFALFANTLLRCETPPSADDVRLLEDGARLFARQTEISLPLALALKRAGRDASAAKLFAIGTAYARDEATRARFAALAEPPAENK